MMMGRRQLLALPALAFLGEPLARAAGKPAAEVAADEEFWVMVRQAFSIDPTIISLNSGANDVMPRSVAEAFLRSAAYSSASPMFLEGNLWTDGRRELVRRRLAAQVRRDPEEIAITRNTTEGLHIVIRGVELAPGDEIITTDQDYFISSWHQRRDREGIVVKQLALPIKPKRPKDLLGPIEDAITPRTKLIQLSHITGDTGQILPVAELCKRARARGIQTLVDGAVSFGIVDCDLDALGCDYFATSLHKGLHAPLGTGALFVRKERIAALWPLGSAYASDEDKHDIRKLENVGTRSLAPFHALPHAIDFFESLGIERITARLRYLKRYWTSQLAGVSRVRFNTRPNDANSAGMVSVRLDGIETEPLGKHLSEHGIWAYPIVTKRYQGLKVAPFYYTLRRDLDQLVSVLADVAKKGLPSGAQ